MPKDTQEEKDARSKAMEEATKYAIDVPLATMRVSLEAIHLAKAMAEIGNPNSASDAGVGALSARAAVRGAYLNVRINSTDLKDKDYLQSVLDEAKQIDLKAEKEENAVLELVEKNL